MSLAEHTKRIHPLVAVAAAAVTVFSLVGIAAITGILPSSHGTSNDASRDNVQQQSLSAPDPRNADNGDKGAPAGKALQPKAAKHQGAGNNNVAAGEGAPRNVPAAQPAPVAQKAPQNSPVGIGVGAVVGGVLGNQVGSGDGKTLATGSADRGLRTRLARHASASHFVLAALRVCE